MIYNIVKSTLWAHLLSVLNMDVSVDSSVVSIIELNVQSNIMVIQIQYKNFLLLIESNLNCPLLHIVLNLHNNHPTWLVSCIFQSS